MHLVTVTVSGAGHLHVVLPAQTPTTEAGTAEVVDTGPSPIAPEKKELLWGAGAFIVLAILVRFFLFPRLKKGMDARHELIRGEQEDAERIRAEAEAELAEYNAALAQVRAFIICLPWGKANFHSRKATTRNDSVPQRISDPSGKIQLWVLVGSSSAARRPIAPRVADMGIS